MGFIVLPFNYFWLGVGVLPRLSTGLSTTQPAPLPYVGCTMSQFQTKGVFVLLSCLLWRSLPDKNLAFSLANSYGMHLVIPVHLSPFLVVCHLSKTFPSKEL